MTSNIEFQEGFMHALEAAAQIAFEGGLEAPYNARIRIAVEFEVDMSERVAHGNYQGSENSIMTPYGEVVYVPLDLRIG